MAASGRLRLGRGLESLVQLPAKYAIARKGRQEARGELWLHCRPPSSGDEERLIWFAPRQIAISGKVYELSATPRFLNDPPEWIFAIDLESDILPPAEPESEPASLMRAWRSDTLWLSLAFLFGDLIGFLILLILFGRGCQ